MNTLNIPLLQGVDQEVNPRLIQNTSPQDCLNTIYEEGKVKSRYGMKNVLSDADLATITCPVYYDGENSYTRQASIKEIRTYLAVNAASNYGKCLVVFTDCQVWRRNKSGSPLLEDVTPATSLDTFTPTITTEGIYKVYSYNISDTGFPKDYVDIAANDWLFVAGKNRLISAVEIGTVGGVASTLKLKVKSHSDSGNPAYAIHVITTNDTSNFQYSIDTFYSSDDTDNVMIYCNGGVQPFLWYSNSSSARFMSATKFVYYKDSTNAAEILSQIKTGKIWKELAVYGNRLLMTDGVQTVYWGGPAMNVNSQVSCLDYRVTMGSGYIQLVNTSDFITGFRKYRNLLWVFKLDSITEVVDTSDFREPFIFNENKANSGTASIRSVVEIDTGLLYLSSQDIMIFDGIAAAAISDPVKKNVFNLLNYDSLPQAFTLNMATFHTALIFYPTGSGSQETPKKCVAYNYKYQLWSFWDFSNIDNAIGFTGCGVWLTDPTGNNYPTWGTMGNLSWSEINAATGAIPISGRMIWGDTVYSNLRPVYVLATKYISTSLPSRLLQYDKSTSDDDNAMSPIYCTVVTKDIDFGDLNTLKQLVQMTMLISSISPVQVSFSTDMGRTWVGTVDVPAYAADPRVPLFVGENAEMVDRTLNLMLKGKRCRVRIISNSRSRFEVESLTFRYQFGGIGLER